MTVQRRLYHIGSGRRAPAQRSLRRANGSPTRRGGRRPVGTRGPRRPVDRSPIRISHSNRLGGCHVGADPWSEPCGRPVGRLGAQTGPPQGSPLQPTTGGPVGNRSRPSDVMASVPLREASDRAESGREFGNSKRGSSGCRYRTGDDLAGRPKISLERQCRPTSPGLTSLAMVIR